MLIFMFAMDRNPRYHRMIVGLIKVGQRRKPVHLQVPMEEHTGSVSRTGIPVLLVTQSQQAGLSLHRIQHHPIQQLLRHNAGQQSVRTRQQSHGRVRIMLLRHRILSTITGLMVEPGRPIQPLLPIHSLHLLMVPIRSK